MTGRLTCSATHAALPSWSVPRARAPTTQW
ncbi:Uncharacterised protein [Mycobacteroides abscessus]|nr:Uncharacterised protein [Mycobacteroides abscessus]